MVLEYVLKYCYLEGIVFRFWSPSPAEMDYLVPGAFTKQQINNLSEDVVVIVHT